MSRIHQTIVRFRASEGGAIAPLFGLMMMVILIMTGISIDISRGTRISSLASSALDAAALAGAKALRLSNPTDAELTALVQEYFTSNFQTNSANGSLQTMQVVANRETGYLLH